MEDDGRNPANQLRLVVEILFFHRVLKRSQGGSLGLLNQSTVLPKWWKCSKI